MPHTSLHPVVLPRLHFLLVGSDVSARRAGGGGPACHPDKEWAWRGSQGGGTDEEEKKTDGVLRVLSWKPCSNDRLQSLRRSFSRSREPLKQIHFRL